MHSRRKWLLVIVPSALLALLSYPMMPIGSLLWPMPHHGGLDLPSASPLYMGLLTLYLVMESIAFGVAIAFLVFGRQHLKAATNRGQATISFVCLAWVTGIWPLHMYAHMHHPMSNHVATLIIDYSFHAPIYIAGSLLVFSLLSIFREKGVAVPTVGQLLRVVLPLAVVIFLFFPAMPIGRLLWPPAEVVGAAPTATQATLYAIDWFLESICTGLGIVLLWHSRSILRALPADFRSGASVLFLGALWIMGNWAPHVMAHNHYGNDLTPLLWIEYLGHVTIYVTGMFMIPRFLRILQDQALIGRAA